MEGTLSKPIKHKTDPNLPNLIPFMFVFLFLTLAERDFWLEL
jgi:hypothetical protein